MNKITKIILGLVGLSVIGIMTFYIVTKDKTSKSHKKAITNPTLDTVAIANVIEDSSLITISRALGVDGEQFTQTKEAGVYSTITNDKLLVIDKNIWKKLIKKIKKKIPQIAEDCKYEYSVYELSNYKFIGLLTYLSSSKNNNNTIAYRATEIKQGEAYSFAGGQICCGCEGGEALVPQQLDAVIDK
jgi:hypothetical protein